MNPHKTVIYWIKFNIQVKLPDFKNSGCIAVLTGSHDKIEVFYIDIDRSKSV